MTPAFPPFPGGGERYAGSLAMALCQRGHQVTAVTTTARLEKEFWAGTVPTSQPPAGEAPLPFRVVRCPVKAMPGGWTGLMMWRKLMVVTSAVFPSLSLLQYMSRYIPPIPTLETTLQQLSEPFDVVHGFNLSWEHPLVAGWHFARQRQLPFVVTPFAHLGQHKRDRVALNATMIHQLHLLRGADQVFTLTSVEKEGLAGYGVPQERMRVVGGGLDPLPTETAVSPPVLPEPFALFVGRLSYDKGAIHAVQAIQRLRQQGVPICLGLVGQTTPQFEQFYRRLGAEERAGIRPLGILNETEKHALLQQATLLLLPSQADSFGIVMLEAWAHGTPVVAARAGGIPGVVDEGQNGLLVPFADVPALSEAVYQLVNDEPRRRQLGENGRNKVHTHYTWSQVAEQVEQGYLSLQRA